jgi:hypothetical protein
MADVNQPIGARKDLDEAPKSVIRLTLPR